MAMHPITHQYWLPRVPICGIVVYLHDYAAHSGEIAHVLPQFMSHGFAVVSYDIQGHGRSSGIHGLIPSFKQLDEDLQLVIDTIVTMEVSANVDGNGDNKGETAPPVFLMGSAFGARLYF